LAKHSYTKKSHKKRGKKSSSSRGRQKSSYLKYFSIFGLVFIFASFGLYYYLFVYQVSIKQNIITNQKIIKENDIKIKELQKLLEQAKKVSKKDNKSPNYLSEIEDLESTKHIKQSQKLLSPKREKLHIKPSTTPKLVIIIDDIISSAHIKKIKSIPLKITMSFLPPIKSHPNSANIAKNLDHIMIHLPLEAYNHRFIQTDTLLAKDSFDKIQNRIRKLKSLYPQAKYINNHTGSKFTSNTKSMLKLLKALKNNGFIFIDSKTTANTKAPYASKKLGIKILSRDTFLDNKPDIAYIHRQLRRAIKKAKYYGYAIAIGHPHPTTFKALMQSLKILKGVEVVFIDEIINF
jgi:polysaccharide deacetylase 2 family uncharacterized protein YibQ